VTEQRRTSQKGGSLDSANIARATLIIIAIVGVAWLLLSLTRLLMLIFASVTIATIFDAVASFLKRRTRIGRGWATTMSIVFIIGFFFAAFALFGTQIARELQSVWETLPTALQGVEAFLDRYGLGDRARELIASGSKDASNLLSRASGYAIAAGSGLADFALVLVAAIFLASNPAVYRRGLLLLLPARAEAPVAATLDEARSGLGGWMLGQAVSSLVVTVLTWLGLMLLGVPASGGLAIIAGLLDVIPMVGPIIAGVPAVLLAFTVSPMTALWTLALFLIIQQIQGNFLQPMIQKHAVDIPPAVLLFAVFAFGVLFGFLGVVLAAPLTVVAYVAVQKLYVETVLGKKLGEGDNIAG
jgi:predicted PurR-regulated permease PerM